MGEQSSANPDSRARPVGKAGRNSIEIEMRTIMRFLDPEHQRYRRTYPRFPGVTLCLDLIRQPNVRGAYLDAVVGDLMKHAAESAEELIESFGHETDGRVRSITLSVIAESRSLKALTLFEEILTGPNEDLRYWAAHGLYKLGTKEARGVLWRGTTHRFEDVEETARFQKMLQEVATWK